MKLLLDTHALLWWLQDDPRLGQQARALIADPAHDVLVSAVSLWEAVVKLRIGKLEADIGAIIEAVAQDGFTWLDIRPPHLLALSRLPTLAGHRDPFDHLLMAQAIAEAAFFVSADRHVPGYPVPNIPCSA